MTSSSCQSSEIYLLILSFVDSFISPVIHLCSRSCKGHPLHLALLKNSLVQRAGGFLSQGRSQSSDAQCIVQASDRQSCLHNANGWYQVSSFGGHQMHANWPFRCVCLSVYVCGMYNTVQCCDDEHLRPGSTSLDLSRVLHGHNWLPWVKSHLAGQNTVSSCRGGKSHHKNKNIW